MRIPPRSVFADYARKILQDHYEWDSPHKFLSLHWDGEKLTCGSYVCIATDVRDDQYPVMMLRTARETIERQPGSPPYGYLIQIEAFAATKPGPDAPEEEHRRFEADRTGHKIHKRPDAIESSVVWCADIHGRLWTAAKTRENPHVIEESFYPPGQTILGGGQFVTGLLGVCNLTAICGHKMPPAAFRHPN